MPWLCWSTGKARAHDGKKKCTLEFQSAKSAENLLKWHHVGEEIKVLGEEISFRSSEGCLLEW